MTNSVQTKAESIFKVTKIFPSTRTNKNSGIVKFLDHYFRKPFVFGQMKEGFSN